MSLDVVTDVFGADEAQTLSEGSLRTCLEQRLARSTAHNVLFMDRDRPCAELPYALRYVVADPAPRRQREWNSTEAVAATASGARCLQVQPLRPLLHKLRWRKSPAEIAAMRRSVAAGAEAVRACIAVTHPGMGEHALAALYEFHVKVKGGAAALAFPPVVGGGMNACTVHYRHADGVLQDGEVVLMDAGAEVLLPSQSRCYSELSCQAHPIQTILDCTGSDIYHIIFSEHAHWHPGLVWGFKAYSAAVPAKQSTPGLRPSDTAGSIRS